MPPTLIPETGAALANANTFASLAQAAAALDASPYGAAWTGVDPDRQARCLIEASSYLSTLRWDGLPATSTQALAWPRGWMYTPDGFAVASNLIPAWLITATARLALWFAEQDASPYVSNGLQPGTELELPGGLRLTPASGAQPPSDVFALVRPYLAGGGSSLVRG